MKNTEFYQTFSYRGISTSHLCKLKVGYLLSKTLSQNLLNSMLSMLSKMNLGQNDININLYKYIDGTN